MKQRIISVLIGVTVVLACHTANQGGKDDVQAEVKNDPTLVQPGKPKLKKEDGKTLATDIASGVSDGEFTPYEKIQQPEFNTEQYKYIEDNAFLHVKDRP